MPLTEADITLVASRTRSAAHVQRQRALARRAAGRAAASGRGEGRPDQVLSSATDGMTISTPVETILDGRKRAGWRWG